MNYRTTFTLMFVGLSLAYASAFAAEPVNDSSSSAPGHTVAMQTTPGKSGTIVSTVRKVYFFRQLDRNGNGQLSRSEIPKDMGNLRRNFIHADFDGNGQLSPEEYVLYSRGLAPKYKGVYHIYVYVNSYGHNNVEHINVNR